MAPPNNDLEFFTQLNAPGGGDFEFFSKLLSTPPPPATPLANLEALQANATPLPDPRPSTAQPAAMAAVAPSFEEIPAAPSMDAALGYWRKRGVDLPDMPAAREAEGFAKKQAVMDFLRAGLMDETGTLRAHVDPELFNRYVGTMRSLVAMTFPGMAPEEAGEVNRTVVERATRDLQGRILGRLNEIEANLSSAGVLQRAAMERERAGLQQDFARVKALGSQADHPRVQDMFFTQVREFARQRAFRTAGDTFEASEAALEAAFLDSIHAESFGGRQSQHQADFRGLLGRVIQGHDRAYAEETGLLHYYRGALREVRAARLGVAPEKAQEVGLDGLLLLAAPSLADDLIKARLRMNVSEQFVDAGRQASVDLVRESAEKIFESARPAMLDDLLRASRRQVEQEAAAFSVGSPAGGILNEAARDMLRLGEGLGQWMQRGLEAAQQIRPELLHPQLAAAHLAHALTETEGRVVGAQEEAQKELAVRGLDAPRDDYFDEAMGALRGRGELTAEQRQRLFNPHNNLLTAAATALWGNFPTQVADRVSRLDLDPSSLRMIYDMSRQKAVQEATKDASLFTESDLQAALLRSRNTPLSAGVVPWFDAKMSASIHYVGKGWRDGLEMLLHSPDDAAVLFGATSVLGVGAAAAGRAGVRALANSGPAVALRTAIQGDRMAAIARDLAKYDPASTQRMRDALIPMVRDAAPEQKRAVLSSMLDNLETIISERREAMLDNNINLGELARGVDDQLMQFRQAAAQLHRGDLDSLLDSAAMTQGIEKWLNHPSAWNKITSLARQVMGMEHRGPGRKLALNNAAVHGDTPLRRIVNEMETIRPEDIFVAPDLLRPEHRSFWQKITGRKSADAGAALHTIANFFAGFQQDVTTWRALRARVQADGMSLLRLAQTKAVNAYRELRVMREAYPPELHPHFDGEMKALLNNATQAKQMRRSYAARSWSDGFSGMAESRALRRLDLLDVLGHVAQRGNMPELFSRYRKIGETHDNFLARISALSAEKSASFRNRIVRDMYQTQSIHAPANFFDEGGLATPEHMAVARETISLTKQIREAAGQEKLTLADFGISRRSIGAEWEKLVRESFTEFTVQQATRRAPGTFMRSLLEGSIILRNADLAQAANATQSLGLSYRANMNIYKRQLRQIQLAYEALSPEERKIYDLAMVAARDDGLHTKLNALRENSRYSDILAATAPPDGDAAVQHVLDLYDDFRIQVVERAHEVGAIDKATRDKYVQPYAGQYYFAHELGRLPVGKTPAIEGRGVETSPTEARRHLSRWRVLVHAANRPPIERTFRTRDQANAYTMQFDPIGNPRHSTSQLTGKLDIEWKARSGDTITILEPLGEKMAGILGPLNPAQASFLGVRKLLINLENRAYLQTLDRPGLSLTPDEFKTMQLTDAGRERAAEFVEVPAVPEKYGAIAGKHVHRALLREADNWAEGSLIRQAIQDSVTDVVGAESAVANLLTAGRNALYGASGMLKAAIGHIKIAMDPALAVGNYLSDIMLWGNAAASGGAPNVSIDWILGSGRQARRDATSIVLRLRHGRAGKGTAGGQEGLLDLMGVVDQAERSAVALAMRNNLFDDSLLGGAGVGEDLNILGAVLDHTGRRTKLEGAIRKRDLLGEAIRGLGEMIDPPDADPRRAKLRARAAGWRRALRNPELPPALRAKLERNLAQLDPVLRDYTGFARAVGSALHSFMVSLGRGGGSRSIRDRHLVAQEIYGNLSNINRVGAFLHQIRRGVDPQVAIDRVNDLMQTYSGVPGVVRKISRHPLASPILSFPYELGRTGVNALRQSPGFFAGWAGAGVGANAAAMAAGGIHPEAMVDIWGRHSGAFPGWTKALSGMTIPAGGGRAIYVGITGLDVINTVGSNPFGVADDILAPWNEDKGVGLLGQLGRTTGNTIAGLLTGGPLLSLASKAIARRDPLSGERYSAGGGLLATARDVAGMFVPSLTPFVGSVASQLRDAAASAPHAYSGRRQDFFRVLAKGVFGAKVIGGAGAVIPAAARPVAEKMVRLGTLALGVPLSDQPWDPGAALSTTAINDRDKVALAVILTADVERSGTGTTKIEWADEFQSLRRAAAWEADPNPTLQARGRALREESIRAISARLALDRQLNDPRFTQDPDPEVAAGMLRRVATLENPMAAFDGFSMPRKIAIIAHAMKYGVAEKEIRDLAQLVIVSERGSRRSPTDPAEVNIARQWLGGVANEARSEDEARALGRLARVLDYYGLVAERTHRRRQLTDEHYGRAFREIERVKRGQSD